jgi:hypothetical protein
MTKIDLGGFKGTYGDPDPSTGVPLGKLHLQDQPFLDAFAKAIGTGVFLAGAFSVCSVREVGLDLAPWMHLVPSGSKHFATNSIGEMFFVAPDHKLHFVMVHDGDTTELQTSREEFFAWLTQPRNQGLYAALGQFHLESRRLKPTEVLTYEPPAAAGGSEDPNTLVAADARATLDRLAAIHFGSKA